MIPLTHLRPWSMGHSSMFRLIFATAFCPFCPPSEASVFARVSLGTLPLLRLAALHFAQRAAGPPRSVCELPLISSSTSCRPCERAQVLRVSHRDWPVP